jgi:hypothetical protein
MNIPFTFEFKTDYESLNNFLEETLKILKKSVLDCYPYMTEYQPRTYNQLSEVIDITFNNEYTVKQWRSLSPSASKCEIEKTQLYSDIEYSVKRLKEEGDMIKIMNSYKFYIWLAKYPDDHFNCADLDEPANGDISYSFYDANFVDNLDEKLVPICWNYHRHTLKEIIEDKPFSYEDIPSNYQGTGTPYQPDILDYADYMLKFKCATKIQKFFLKNYYSPHTKIGKRRFNKELNKLEAL